jgi:hypothetical protein
MRERSNVLHVTQGTSHITWLSVDLDSFSLSGGSGAR